jgi:chromosome partitioning protein
MPPRTPRPVLTVLNLKGGVGKTHTVWLLAGVCQERERRLLCIDLDTQGNLTRSLLPDGYSGPGVEALFDPRSEIEPTALVHPTRFSHVNVIPAGPALVPFDLADQRAWERSDLHLSLIDVVRELSQDYDFVVFDCPPRLSLASFAALCASDGVVIPLEPADWGAQGIVQVTEAVEYVRRRHNPDLTLLGYLVSRYKRARSFQRAYLVKLREHFGKLAFDTLVPDVSLFEKSVTLNVPIVLHAPSSVEAGIARRLFAEVQRRLQRGRARRSPSGRQNVRNAGELAAARG